MAPRRIRIVGLVCVGVYAGFIAWLYARQPQTIVELTGGVAAAVGAYRIDATSFDEGVQAFRREEYEAARRAFARADPAHQDAVTQFYIAYSYYRQGWGRVTNDDALFAAGLEAARHAETLAPGGRVIVRDDGLGMQTSDELIIELEQGLRVELDDFNPWRLVRERK